MSKKLHIFTAGCVMKQVKDAVEAYNAAGGDAEFKGGGSVDLVRSAIAGDPCDLLITADNALIDSMLLPEYTDGYYIFAGNAMSISSTDPGNPITDDNWREKLLAPGATFGHFNPQGDPGGYRAVMACMLADNIEPGLGKKLVDSPGRIIMSGPNGPKPDYVFGYRSGPVSRGMVFADLPVEMNLSDPACNDLYAQAVIDLGDGNSVKGSAICHALTIPFAAVARDEAKEFVKIFLATDFAAAGFIPRGEHVGKKQF